MNCSPHTLSLCGPQETWATEGGSSGTRADRGWSRRPGAVPSPLCAAAGTYVPGEERSEWCLAHPRAT